MACRVDVPGIDPETVVIKVEAFACHFVALNFYTCVISEDKCGIYFTNLFSVVPSSPVLLTGCWSASVALALRQRPVESPSCPEKYLLCVVRLLVNMRVVMLRLFCGSKDAVARQTKAQVWDIRSLSHD